jgi:trans-2,3-dihydro-3-hydroxyanthranilate isomerase
MKFFLLDVFTLGEDSGNQLAVVLTSQALPESKMLSIAREFNFSETVFITDIDSALPELRIFTPKAELTFAGHPIIGAAWLIARLTTRQDQELKLKLPVGVTQVQASEQGARLIFPGQPKVSSFMGPLNEVLEQCQIQEAVNVGDIRLINVGPEFLLIPLLTGEALSNAVSPHQLPLPLKVYLVHEESPLQWSARMFAPAYGIIEDAATGSAACALAAFMKEVRGIDQGQIVISQGKEIDRPSKLVVGWDDKISLGGEVSLWGQGELL